MTTIATDGKTMAADGCESYCGTVVNYSADKLIPLRSGGVLGACGSLVDAAAVAEWLDGDIEDRPEVASDFGALVLHSSGLVEWLSDKLRPTPAMIPAAMGSGMDFAIGAMEAGSSPAEAVRIACKRDTGSGGDITEMSPAGHCEAAA